MSGGNPRSHKSRHIIDVSLRAAVNAAVDMLRQTLGDANLPANWAIDASGMSSKQFYTAVGQAQRRRYRIGGVVVNSNRSKRFVVRLPYPFNHHRLWASDHEGINGIAGAIGVHFINEKHGAESQSGKLKGYNVRSLKARVEADGLYIYESGKTHIKIGPIPQPFVDCIQNRIQEIIADRSGKAPSKRARCAEEGETLAYHVPDADTAGLELDQMDLISELGSLSGLPKPGGLDDLCDETPYLGVPDDFLAEQGPGPAPATSPFIFSKPHLRSSASSSSMAQTVSELSLKFFPDDEYFVASLSINGRYYPLGIYENTHFNQNNARALAEELQAIMSSPPYQLTPNTNDIRGVAEEIMCSDIYLEYFYPQLDFFAGDDPWTSRWIQEQSWLALENKDYVDEFHVYLRLCQKMERAIRNKDMVMLSQAVNILKAANTPIGYIVPSHDPFPVAKRQHA